MLEIKNIIKLYNSTIVLNDISFSIAKGKIFGIIGPNGAGKTTTLRIILNIIKPTSGEIFFNQKKIDHSFLNKTGYLPEERGLYPKSKMKDVLIYFAKLKGLNNSLAEEKSYYWIKKLNLENYIHYNVDELSKGNQQKVQFISAIIHDPEILILDEPFSGFDPVNQSIFKEIINDFKSEKYIILSTHLMDLAQSLCEDIFLINNGREVISGNLNSVLNSNNSNIFEMRTSNDFEFSEYAKKLGVKISQINKNYYNVYLGSLSPSEFLRSLSKIVDILEFKSIQQTLNQKFLELINKI